MCYDLLGLSAIPYIDSQDPNSYLLSSDKSSFPNPNCIKYPRPYSVPQYERFTFIIELNYRKVIATPGAHW